MSRDASFLGNVWEFSYKLGFLSDSKELDEFKEQGFKWLKEQVAELKGGHREKALEVLETLEKKVPFNPLKEERDLKFELDGSWENILGFLFLEGYYSGAFQRREFGNVELIRYKMETEGGDVGEWENADLIFIADNTLHVADLKLAGAVKAIEYMLGSPTKSDINSIPYRVAGVPVNLSVGEIGLSKLLETLGKIRDKLVDLESISVEHSGFLQVLSYCVDFLSSKENEDRVQNLTEARLSLIYPVQEIFSAFSKIDDLEKVKKFRYFVSGLYRNAKNQKEYNQSQIRELTEGELRREIEELRKRMREKEQDKEVVEVDSIDEARKHVGMALGEFFKKEEPVKVLCLLHSAGSGKTSQTRNRILELEGNHLVLYIVTRKVILEDEKNTLLGIKDKNIRVVYVYDKLRQKAKVVKNRGDTYEPEGKEEGILKRTVDEIVAIVNGKEKPRFIFAFITQQAIVDTMWDKNTLRHLKKELLRTYILKDYMLHIIVDEFLGASNGLFVLNEFMEILREVKRMKEGNPDIKGAHLYLFDANGYTPYILERMLKEYEHFDVIPSCFILSEFVEKLDFEHKGLNVYAYAKHGYPAPAIYMRRKFIKLKESIEKREDELIANVADYIKQTFKNEKESAFVFVQNKKHIARLKEALERDGFKVLIATADSKKSKEYINDESTGDIVLATSTISRGIDLSRENKPFNHIYVVIYDWGIENSMVELLQSISRARGDKTTETQPKNLYLIYVIEPVDGYIGRRLKDSFDGQKEEERLMLEYERHSLWQKLELDSLVSGIIRQFVKNKKEKGLVPIPNQYRTKYIPNPLSNLESALDFLENIYYVEEDEDKKKNIFRLREKLEKAASVSVTNLDLGKSFRYYHPYLLIENQEVQIEVDKGLKKDIDRLFAEVKDTLEKHNKDKTREVEKLINGELLPSSRLTLPVLIPVYSLVLMRHFLKDGDIVKFSVKGRVGRGGADVLLGGLEITTQCYKNERTKTYACILLTEDYPYKEILSGRFVKFPVEFVKSLLEKEEG